ncbi:MAG: cellobiose phosphorylase [Candidatus Omnitrophica bacterium]|nr:cellobiose phosphorylase [Candidatus Omnitrophota bacterium]
MVKYRLEGEEFVIEDYARARAFASFLPGIAGLWGIPLWAFYVNRGQAIAGFGIQDKDHPIMEFRPANRAFRLAPWQGFRTFLKFSSRGRGGWYEPFRSPAPNGRSPIVQRMRIRMADLMLEETHRALGLEVGVHYFTIPHEPYAGLARVLTITNRSRKALAYELLDGLPVIIPHGMRDSFLKHMSRTMEAWVTVDHLDQGVPFYRLKVEPSDRPEVIPIRAGNFYVGSSQVNGRTTPLQPLVDPTAIFGCREDFSAPEAFYERGFRPPRRQLVQDKTPCAMGYGRVRLTAGATQTVFSLFGHADSPEHVTTHLPAMRDPRFFASKAADNFALIRHLTDAVATKSRSPQFDAYCRQTFLDNLLRGGHPVTLGRGNGRKVLYVYSRKHGDLERDYNFFVVPPTHFSQGNANYRDVNQNRRNDAWFAPEVGEQNIVTFFNLLQADGYNPLVYKGTRYVPTPEALNPPVLREVLGKSFTPGEMLRRMERRQVDTGESPEAVLHRVMEQSREVEDAEHSEGFWTDHWTYNLDLLESFLALYPERRDALLFARQAFTFYDNAHVVLPRTARYRLVHGAVRQLHAVARDPEKEALIRSRAEEPHVLRSQQGQGPVYRTTLIVKMLCVVANKLASFDPDGIGIDMEADKPNWYDALNGLPALLGSSLCETFELKRWIEWLLGAVEDARQLPSSIAVPEELHELSMALHGLWREQAAAYWAKSAEAKERYRLRVKLGFSGIEAPLTREALVAFLRGALEKVERGIAQGFDKASGLYHSYFYYEVTAHTTVSDGDAAGMLPTAWKRHPLPLFLNGQVHALRLERNLQRARRLHRAVTQSALYDKKLSMYRVCASLDSAPEEIGRCRIFNPGWLEHQSIWLHMEYKYLLELLRSGLYAEYYEQLPKQLIPFQPPARYGRSVLENSSFLVSSAYADASLHGGGFVARLSGATAEFLHLWLWMTAGKAPFAVNDRGELTLRFAPILSAELFTARGTFEFTFLGQARVTYRNPKHRATFGPKGVTPAMITMRPRSGNPMTFSGGVIPSPYAAMVRAGAIAAIEIDLA